MALNFKFSVWLTFVWILQFAQNVFSTSCDVVKLHSNLSTYIIDFSSDSRDSNSLYYPFFCKMLMTDTGLRLRASVVYNQTKPGCNNGYLSIGNNKHHLDKNSLTSYQFCNVTKDVEIVSRSNVLWIIVKETLKTRVSGHIRIDSKSYVKCNSTQFRCSPVQCVPVTSICDDVRDCENGRDEYCSKLSNSQRSNDVCFLCNDESACISPSLPRYDYKWGKQLWYLCDGFQHCSDGSDEQKDKCEISWRLNHDLTTCSNDLEIQFLTWKTDRCSQISCSNKSVCIQEYTDIQRLYNSSIIIPACALIIVAVGAVCFFVRVSKKKRRRRKRKNEFITTTCQFYRDTPANETITRLRSNDDQLL